MNGYTRSEVAEQRERHRRNMDEMRNAAERVNKLIADLETGKTELTKYNHISLCNLYLYASECYYAHDTSVMTDGMFDKICKYLLEQFDVLEMVGVWHVGRNIVRGNLEAGTCIGVTFPVPVQNIAHFLREIQAEEMMEMLG